MCREYLLSFAGLSVKMPVPASTPLPKPPFLLISRDVRFIVPSQNTALSCDLLFFFSLRPHLTLLGNPVWAFLFAV